MSDTEEPIPPDIDMSDPKNFQPPDWIDPAMLLNRGVYRVRSRNLPYGVYEAAGKGFIGIREKMGAVYLFEEYEYDSSAMHGTARALEYLGQLPDEIEAVENFQGGCSRCGGSIEYREELKGRFDPESRDWTSWPWVCENGCTKDDEGSYPGGTLKTNEPLFAYLMGLDPAMTRCATCGVIAFYGTPWDSDEGSWKHIGGFGWQREDKDDHEVVPT